MRKIILPLVLAGVIMSGCATSPKDIPQKLFGDPVSWEDGVTDREILKDLSEYRQRLTEGMFVGGYSRMGATALGRAFSAASAITGAGWLGLAGGASYEAQDYIAGLAKTNTCLAGIKMLDDAELRYFNSLIADKERKELTAEGVKLYRDLIKVKHIVRNTLFGIPSEGL